MREKERNTTTQQPEKKKSGFRSAMQFIYKIRGVFMSIPVLFGGIWLALRNYKLLPKEISLNLLTGGDTAQMISRDLAVYGPLVVTLVCLLLMFCSRKKLYPWLISLFSLALPLLIWFSFVFQG